MAAETAVAAAYRALQQALVNAGDWNGRVYPQIAPSGVVRPYVVYFRAAGGEANSRIQQDAEIVLTVKCVAESLQQALLGAGQLSAALNDKGSYDVSSGALNGGAYWTIQTSTQETAVELHELIDGLDVWHQGHDFRLVMQRR